MQRSIPVPTLQDYTECFHDKEVHITGAMIVYKCDKVSKRNQLCMINISDIVSSIYQLYMINISDMVSSRYQLYMINMSDMESNRNQLYMTNISNMVSKNMYNYGEIQLGLKKW